MFRKTLMVLVAAVLMAATAANAQNPYIELLRNDVKTQKVAIITEVMQFTDEESEIFWPLYREYDVEMAALSDMRIASLKSYAENYDSLTDEMAKDMADEHFKLQEKKLKLKKKYYKKFQKSLSPVKAAKVIQLENQIDLLIDVQIASALPLIE